MLKEASNGYIMHKKIGYLVFWLTSQRMPQSCCLNTYAKCDLKFDLKQFLQKCFQGRVAHELTRD